MKKRSRYSRATFEGARWLICDGPGRKGRSARLGVADHALDRGESPPQAALDLVDPLVRPVDPHGRIDVAVEVADLALARLAHAHVVDVAQRLAIGGKGRERRAHLLDAGRRRLRARYAIHLQRLAGGP